MVIPLTRVRESLAMGRCHNFQFYMTSIKYFVLLYIAWVNSSWKRLKSAESSYKLQTEFVLCSEYFLCALQLPSLLSLFIRQKLWEDRDFFSHITGWLHGPSFLLLSVGECYFTFWAVFCCLSFVTWETEGENRRGCSWLVVFQMGLSILSVFTQGKLVSVWHSSALDFGIKFRFAFYTFRDLHTFLYIYLLAFLLLFSPLALLFAVSISPLSS